MVSFFTIISEDTPRRREDSEDVCGDGEDSKSALKMRRGRERKFVIVKFYEREREVRV